MSSRLNLSLSYLVLFLQWASFSLYRWRIDFLQSGARFPLDDLIDVRGGEGLMELEITIRNAAAKRSVSIDSKLLNQISNDALKESYIQNLREDLGVSQSEFRHARLQKHFEEVSLTVTDWSLSMPKTVTDMLVEFLSTRNDEQRIYLVHLDLHGSMPRLLRAMLDNREYFESVASSLETLELSLEDVDPQADFLPLFPHLLALRMYKPEFPSRREDQRSHYGTRLLSRNENSVRDIAIVGLQADQRIFDNILKSLASRLLSPSSLFFVFLQMFCYILSKHLWFLRHFVPMQGEEFQGRPSTTLWLVSNLPNVLFALRTLGDLLGDFRARAWSLGPLCFGLSAGEMSSICSIRIHFWTKIFLFCECMLLVWRTCMLHDCMYVYERFAGVCVRVRMHRCTVMVFERVGGGPGHCVSEVV